MRQLSFCAEEGALRVRSGSVHGVTPDRIPDPYAPQHGSPQWAPEHYDLTLDYRVATNALHGVAVVRLRTRADVNRLRFDLHGLTVSKVRVDGVRASFQRGAGQVVVTLPHRLSVGERATVEITYGGKPRPLNSPWGGLGWEELTEGSLVASQPTGAPSWFPCNDHPALRATYRFEMTADSSYTVVANGSLAAKRTRSGHTTWVYEQRQPMATYLAAVHVGRYAQVSLSDHGVEQVAFVPQSLVRRAKNDLPVHRAMMRLFEDVFGPYPFDRYSVVVTADKLDIPIEAQGLSTFGSNHVNGHGGDERMFAHELAHQWFGNAVTLRRWQDMWLNEGFACYAEWLWWDHSGQRTVEATARSHYRRLCGAKRFVHLGDPGPVDMFDDQVYKRGALTLHAVRHSLGDARFFEMVRSWVEWGRVHGATTSSFVAHLWGVDPTGHAAAVCQRWLSSGAPPQFPGAGEGISGLA